VWRSSLTGGARPPSPSADLLRVGVRGPDVIDPGELFDHRAVHRLADPEQTQAARRSG